MKPLNPLLAAVATVALGAGLIVGSPSVRADEAYNFEAARALGTPEALEAFLTMYPTGALAPKAVQELAGMSVPGEDQRVRDANADGTGRPASLGGLSIY